MLTGSQKPYTLPLQSAFWTMPVIDSRTPRVTMPGARRRRSRPPMPRARPRSMRPNAAKHARPTQVFGGLMESGWLTVPETRMEADGARDSGPGDSAGLGRTPMPRRKGWRSRLQPRRSAAHTAGRTASGTRASPGSSVVSCGSRAGRVGPQTASATSTSPSSIGPFTPRLSRDTCSRARPHAPAGGAQDDERPPRPVVDGPERQRAPRDDEQNQPSHVISPSAGPVAPPSSRPVAPRDCRSPGAGTVAL